MDAARQAMTQAAEQAKRASAGGRTAAPPGGATGACAPGRAAGSEPGRCRSALSAGARAAAPPGPGQGADESAGRRSARRPGRPRGRTADTAQPAGQCAAGHARAAARNTPSAGGAGTTRPRLLVAVQDSGPGVAPRCASACSPRLPRAAPRGWAGPDVEPELAESMGGSLELAASGPTAEPASSCCCLRRAPVHAPMHPRHAPPHRIHTTTTNRTHDRRDLPKTCTPLIHLVDDDEGRARQPGPADRHRGPARAVLGRSAGLSRRAGPPGHRRHRDGRAHARHRRTGPAGPAGGAGRGPARDHAHRPWHGGHVPARLQGPARPSSWKSPWTTKC